MSQWRKKINLLVISIIFITNEVHGLIGGTNVGQQQAYSEVSVKFRNRHICTGVFITVAHVLTAATCVCKSDRFLNVVDITIRSGSNDLKKNSTTQKVRHIFCHPEFKNFQPYGSLNNLAVLTLRSTIKKSLNQTAIDVTARAPNDDEECVLRAWSGSKLQIISPVHITSNVKCNLLMQYDRLERDHVCSIMPRYTVTKGDEGAPLICDDKVVGAFSWKYDGPKYNELEVPYVYTNLYEHRKFIKKATIFP